MKDVRITIYKDHKVQAKEMELLKYNEEAKERAQLFIDYLTKKQKDNFTNPVISCLNTHTFIVQPNMLELRNTYAVKPTTFKVLKKQTVSKSGYPEYRCLAIALLRPSGKVKYLTYSESEAERVKQEVASGNITEKVFYIYYLWTVRDMTLK